MRIAQLTGVYPPQADTSLLVSTVRRSGICRGARVLDLFTGSGVVAIAAAHAGAGSVTAVDVSKRAVVAARVNALLNGARVAVGRRDALAPPERAQFDVLLANPPYVPVPDLPDLPDYEEGAGEALSWDAGPDGRRFLDPLCDLAPRLLAERGALMLVQSSLCDPRATLRMLNQHGLEARIVATRNVSFGPVLRSRIRYLQEAGLTINGQEHEELVVIRADATT